LGGALILTGGLNNTAELNDVWSFDGAAWTQLLAAAPWTPRSFHTVEAFTPAGGSGPLLVLTGGGDMHQEYGQVWTSPDGVAWSLLTANPGWSARCAHATVLAGAQMLLFGGMHNDSVAQLALEDAWASSDGGATWAQQPQPPWGKRSFLSAALWDGAVYVSGGWWFNWTGTPDPLVPFTYVYYSDVWKLTLPANSSLGAEAGSAALRGLLGGSEAASAAAAGAGGA
jgi:hypothetical protein